MFFFSTHQLKHASRSLERECTVFRTKDWEQEAQVNGSRSSQSKGPWEEFVWVGLKSMWFMPESVSFSNTEAQYYSNLHPFLYPVPSLFSILHIMDVYWMTLQMNWFEYKAQSLGLCQFVSYPCSSLDSSSWKLSCVEAHIWNSLLRHLNYFLKVTV